jgi:Bacterial archaeo-eukaryotic release factor family 7
MGTYLETLPVTGWKIPDEQAIRALCKGEGACISLYLSAHSAGSGTTPTRDRLRALRPEFEQVLRRRGVLAPDCADLLAPIDDLTTSPHLQSGHNEGIALFRSPNQFLAFRLPWAVRELWAVEGRFLIRPLLEMIRASRPFYMLLLGRKHVRLFHCLGKESHLVSLPAEVPVDFDTFEATDAPDHDLLNHSSSGPSTGQMGGVLFGTGGEQDKAYRKMHDFHKAISRGLRSVLASGEEPLVLAGTDADVASYMKVNLYPRTVERSVGCMADNSLGPAELASLAAKIVHEWMSPEELRARQVYERSSHQLTSAEMLAILSAAAGGRVMNLYVAAGSTPQKGDVDQIIGHLGLAGEFPASADDLTNAAIVETLRTGGSAWTLPADQMPEPVELAAVFRY